MRDLSSLVILRTAVPATERDGKSKTLQLSSGQKGRENRLMGAPVLVTAVKEGDFLNI